MSTPCQQNTSIPKQQSSRVIAPAISAFDYAAVAKVIGATRNASVLWVRISLAPPPIFGAPTAPAASLTVWDASSSQLTLFVMLLATLIFLPVVLVYTAIVFAVLRGRVTAKRIEHNSSGFY